MKCERCGAEIPLGNVYCGVCGKEVQLVPDYSILEDDILSDIIQEGARDGSFLQKKPLRGNAETGKSGGDEGENAEKGANSGFDGENGEKRIGGSGEGNRRTDGSRGSGGEASGRAVRKGGGRKRGRISGRKAFLLAFAVCAVIGTAALALSVERARIQEERDNSYDYQYEMAEQSLSEKDYENALRYFGRALELSPSDRAAREQMIEIYLSTGEKEEAVAILEEMIEEDSGDKEAYQKLIEIYDDEEAYDKILLLCEDVKDADILELFSDYLVDQPSFSSISGTYGKSMKIEISSSKGYDIYYTMDGSDPASHGILYQEPISLDEEGTTVITAVTENAKGIYSEPAKATYTIKYVAPDTPRVTPAGGTYTEPQTITIQVPSDCAAYYTWDGSDPTTSSTRYAGSIEMPAGNQVLSVILVNSAGLKSNVYRVNYIYLPQ